MTRTVRTTLSLFLGLFISLPACAPERAARAQPADAEARADEPARPASVLRSLPQWTNDGKPREVAVLLETDELKIAAIALRRGTTLPEHTAASAVTIQAIRGGGTMAAGASSHALRPGDIVTLAPDVPHSLTPRDEDLVVLLVHYLKRRV